MVSRACVGDSPFLHASALHAETRSATLFAVYNKIGAFENIRLVMLREARRSIYLGIFLSLSLSLWTPRCTSTCDKLFRSISYVTIFSLVETTTTSPTRLISINANIRDAKYLHLNITVCATTGHCHCCQELGAYMYTHEKQHRAHVSPNLVRTYVPGFTLIDPRSSLRRKRGWARVNVAPRGRKKKHRFPSHGEKNAIGTMV